MSDTAKKAAAKPSSRTSEQGSRDPGTPATNAAGVKPKTGKAPAKAKSAASGEAQSAKTGTVKITQVVGTIARKWDQEATLRGLGLGKRHKTRVLQDTPEVRGMIYKVRHLIKVEKAS